MSNIIVNEIIQKPPKSAKKLLRYLSHSRDKFSLVGDIEEEYNEIASENRRRQANLWYWQQIAASFPGFIKRTILWSFIMFNNYLKITFRNLLKHKTYSIINISGLALGMACSFLIATYVMYELSYDNYHENADKIYRIAAPFAASISQAPLAAALQEEFPEIEKYTRIYASKIWNDQELVSTEEKELYTYNFFTADPEILEIFSFQFVKGDKSSALEDPKSVILSEKMAEYFFGDRDPIGEVITYENRSEFIISGVIRNIPGNSHFKFDFLAPLSNTLNTYESERWDNSAFVTYLLLPENYNTKKISERIPKIVGEKTGREDKNQYFLQPLKDIHLHSKLGKEIEPNGDILNVQIFSAIAFLILLIACMNYINLSTARSAGRSKEVGLRKVIGAKRKQLIMQFLGESVLLSIIALILALILIELLTPGFCRLFAIPQNDNILSGPISIIVLSVITVSAGLLSGIFPALILSSFKPILALKPGLVSEYKKRISLRNVLVIFQFVVSISLIVCTAIIFNQMRFIQNKDLGLDKEQIIVFQTGRSAEVISKVRVLEESFRQVPGVMNVCASIRVPGKRPFWGGISKLSGTEKEKELKSVQALNADYDFIKTYNLKILLGRDFSLEHPEDETASFILNETAVKLMNWESPQEAIDQPLKVNGQDGKVIGIVKDFHFVSMHTKIAPIAMYIQPERYYNLSAKINTKNIPEIMDSFRASWEEILPDRPFKYYFLDEVYSSYYNSDVKTGNLVGYFTLFSLFITCLGLFGLASFTAERRRKEIGIRKILGASLPGITVMLIKDFLVWLGIASVIAWPLSYFSMNKWLQNFAYKTEIGISVFILSGLLVFIIVKITVGYQSIKGARANPVDSLRYE